MTNCSISAKEQVLSCKNNTESLEKLTMAQKANTLAAKASSTAIKGVSVAMNMLAGIALTAVISAAITGIDNLIHRTEKIKEAAAEAQNAITNAQNTLKTMSDTISENKDRFLELSEGVDRFSNNLKLSEADYAEYLAISQKLAEIAPGLIVGYDEQGNALLSIGNNAEETAQKLDNLLGSQQELTKQTLVDNLDSIAQGVHVEVTETKDDITQLKQQLAAMEKESEQINLDIADVVRNGNSIFQFTDKNDPLRKYKTAFLDSLEAANIGWEDIGNDQILVNDFSSAKDNGGADGNEVRDIALQEAQDYYNAKLNLENSMHDASIAGLKKEIAEKEDIVEDSYSKMTANLQAWMENNYDYQYLSDNSQSIADALLPNIDWDNLGIDLLSGEDYENYINEHILTPLMNVQPKDKEEVNKLFSDLLSFEDGDLDIIPFVQQMQRRLQELEININLTPIISDEQESYDKLHRSISNIAEDSNGNYITSFGDKVDYKEYQTLLEYTKDFNAEQIELWNTATLGARNAAEALEKYQEATQSDNESSLSDIDILTQIQSLSKGLEQLSSIYADISDGGVFDWSALLNNEGFHTAFGEFGDTYDNFIKTVSNAPDDLAACQDALNALTTDYIYSAKDENGNSIMRNLTEETKEATVTMLEHMGIKNALEIVEHQIAQNTGYLSDAKKEQANIYNQLAQEVHSEAEAEYLSKLSSLDLTNATYAEIQSLIDEGNTLGLATNALILFKLNKSQANNETLNTSADINNLLSVASAAGIATKSIGKLAGLKAAYDNALKTGRTNEALAISAEMKKAAADAQEDILNFTPEIKYAGSPSYNSNNSSQSNTVKEETKETFNFIETAITHVESAIDRVKSKAGEAFNSFKSRSKAYSDAIAKITGEISIQEQAKQQYTANRDNVGLSEEWAAQVRDGSLNIAEIGDSALKEQIRKYQEWNDKVNECDKSIEDLKKEQKELVNENIELLITKYEKLAARASNAVQRTQNRIDLKEALGGSANIRNYISMNEGLSKQIGYIREQNKELKEQQKNVPKCSEAWYEYQEQIDSNTASVQNLTKSMVENARAAASLAGEKADKNVEQYDSKDELYDAKIANAATAKQKNNLIDKKVKNIDKRQEEYEKAVVTSTDNLNSSASEIQRMKSKKTNTNNKTANAQNKTYNAVLKKVKAQISSGRKIGDSLLNQAYQLNDNYELWNACIQYNEYFDAKEKNKTIADLYAETSKQEKADLALEKFNNTAEEYDNKLRLGEQKKTAANNRISLANAQGKQASASDYEELIDIEQDQQKILINKRDALEKAFHDAVNKGSIKEGSDEWYEMLEAIQAVTDEIDESTQSLVEHQNALRQLEWDKFDDEMETFQRRNSNRDYQINMLSHKELVDDETGSFTDEGNATLSLRKSNYQDYLTQAAKYRQEYEKLQKQIAKGELSAEDENIIARLRELEDAHHDAMLSAEEGKDSIADLIKEGYQAQLNTLSELIQKYKDLRQSEKDAYEYQKSIAEKTKNIASLQKQLAAYGTNDTEEARAKIQQIKVDLENARQDLRDTEYEKYLSDTNDMLDELYNDYEAFIDEKLNNTDELLANLDISINNMSADVITALNSIHASNETLLQALGSSDIPPTLSRDSGGTPRISVSSPITDNFGRGLISESAGYANPVNISIGDIILQDVQNPEQFSRQLIEIIADNSKVQRTIQAVSVDRLASGSTLSVKRFK